MNLWGILPWTSMISMKFTMISMNLWGKVSKLHELVIIFTAVSKDISAFAPLTAVSKRPDIGGLAPDALMAGEMPKVDDGGDGTNLGDDDHASWCVEHMGVEPKIGWFYPQNGWWKSWTPLLKWMIWGYHYFWKHPYQISEGRLEVFVCFFFCGEDPKSNRKE